MKESDIDFGETNTEVHITNGAVELHYTKNEPEHGVITISRPRLPDTKIELKDWATLFQVMSDFNAFIAWSKAKEELNGE